MVCVCNTPANPDKKLLGCTDEACKKWMHEQCVLDDILKKTYSRLGTDKPHLPPESTETKKGEDDAEGKRPLSPTEPGTAVSAQHSIDVKSGESAINGSDNVDVKQADDDDAHAAPEDSASQTASGRPRRSTSEKADPAISTNGKSVGKTAASKKGSARPKKKGDANAEPLRPWLGLFEAALLTEVNGPPTIEVKDIREGIVGGIKVWTEPVTCLLCGNKVN